jgi:hypothetical protein
VSIWHGSCEIPPHGRCYLYHRDTDALMRLECPAAATTSRSGFAPACHGSRKRWVRGWETHSHDATENAAKRKESWNKAPRNTRN